MGAFLFYLLICVTAGYAAARLWLHGDEMAADYRRVSEDLDIPWYEKTNNWPGVKDPELTNLVGAFIASGIALVTGALSLKSLLTWLA